MKSVFTAIAVLTLAGCSQFSQKSETLHYQCGGTQLTVALDNKQDKVRFVMDGKQLNLPQVVAASGTRYSDGYYTFWSKGDSAFIERGDKIVMNDCVLVPSK
ncbi:hypothetical protein PL78_05805 [Yersinia entomophaga]|uniref:C-type lysozyme inhibitor domain-containing protein n=1 Tax=Yersinia entomophaga TaxID=935293 RepID=A0ABN4PSM7_YERET|nr:MULTISPECIES: MliC family protein [Yersinia]ANI29356.1 hypothetical protein PL78_05805 [Yersinia entomophaga]OWF88318.1 lysozyme inhibitor [Yersinia entomophaga]